jgi:hypothetical protein
MKLEEYKKNWQNQYIPFEVAQHQERLIKKAEKDGYKIGKSETLRILSRVYKNNK